MAVDAGAPCDSVSNCTEMYDCIGEIGNRTCQCSPVYGWVGESCKERTPVLIYNRWASGILFVWALLIVVLGLRSMMLNLYIDHLKRNTLFFCIFFTILGSACLSVVEFLRFHAFQKSTRYEKTVFVILSTVDSALEIEYNDYAIIFDIVGVGLGSFALLFLYLSWEELLETISQRPPGMKNFDLNKRIIFKILSIVIFIFLTSILIEIFSNQVGLPFYIAVIFNIIFPIFYLKYSIKLIKTLENIINTSGQSKALADVIHFIRFTRNVIFFCLIFGIPSNITRYLKIDYEYALSSTTNDLGSFAIFHFIHDSAITLSLLMYTTIAWYVNSVTPGAIVGDQYPILCCIFCCWDAQNHKLIPEDQEDYVASVFATTRAAQSLAQDYKI